MNINTSPLLADVLKVIGQFIFDSFDSTYWKDSSDEDDKKLKEAAYKFLDLLQESYVLILWPESQLLMEKDWFEEEAILETEGKFGSSAYFIPINRILEF